MVPTTHARLGLPAFCSLMLRPPRGGGAVRAGIELASSYGTDWVKLASASSCSFFPAGPGYRIKRIKRRGKQADEQPDRRAQESLAKGRFWPKIEVTRSRTRSMVCFGSCNLLRESRPGHQPAFLTWETITAPANALISVMHDILDYARIDPASASERIEFDLEELLSDSSACSPPMPLNKQLAVYCPRTQVSRYPVGATLTRLKQCYSTRMSERR